MYCLDTMRCRNRKIVGHYYETVPPRERLANRLRALALTTIDEDRQILAAYEKAAEPVKALMAEMDVADLKRVSEIP